MRPPPLNMRDAGVALCVNIPVIHHQLFRIAAGNAMMGDVDVFRDTEPPGKHEACETRILRSSLLDVIVDEVADRLNTSASR